LCLTSADCKHECSGGDRDSDFWHVTRAKGGLASDDDIAPAGGGFQACYRDCMDCAAQTNPPCEYYGSGDSRGCGTGGSSCGGGSLDCFCPDIEIDDYDGTAACCAELMHDSDNVPWPWIIEVCGGEEYVGGPCTTIGYFCHFSNHDWYNLGAGNDTWSGAGVTVANQCVPIVITKVTKITNSGAWPTNIFFSSTNLNNPRPGNIIRVMHQLCTTSRRSIIIVYFNIGTKTVERTSTTTTTTSTTTS
jgi:hypothetical protein